MNISSKVLSVGSEINLRNTDLQLRALINLCGQKFQQMLNIFYGRKVDANFKLSHEKINFLNGHMHANIMEMAYPL